MEIPRVLFIGGAPSTGKSSVAMKLGSRLDRSVISTDDLGAAVRTLVPSSISPDLHAGVSSDYIKYHAEVPVEDRIKHSLVAHRALWPAIDSVARRHRTWDRPAIVEGWALLPALVAESYSKSGVWLSIPPEIEMERLRSNPSFYDNADEPDLFLSSFCQRSEKFTMHIETSCSKLGLPFIRLRSENAEEVAEIVLSYLSDKGTV